MSQSKLFGSAILAVAGQILYILLVVFIMTNGEHLFGEGSKILGTMAFLLLFVISALISGVFILGRPLLLYADGNKRDALFLFAYEVGLLVLSLVILILSRL